MVELAYWIAGKSRLQECYISTKKATTLAFVYGSRVAKFPAKIEANDTS